MQIRGFLDHFPLGVLFLATLAIVFISLEGGFRVGRFRSRLDEPEKESSVGAMVGATLGLLAFLLAFTFGMAGSRYDGRRQVFLGEVNAIGTTYLRADLLPEPYRTAARDILRQYAAIRYDALHPAAIEQAILRSEELQARLWQQAVAAGKREPGSIVVGLFIQSLNEMIDLHTRRVSAGLRSRVPEVIWIVLYAITFLSMAATGYHSGLAGGRRSLAIPVLALVFSAVVLLIADLDRPGEGMIKVNQQAMRDLLKSMVSSSHTSAP